MDRTFDFDDNGDLTDGTRLRFAYSSPGIPGSAMFIDDADNGRGYRINVGEHGLLALHMDAHGHTTIDLDTDASEPDEPANEDYSRLNKRELTELCDERGIRYKANATNKVLRQLLEKS